MDNCFDIAFVLSARRRRLERKRESTKHLLSEERAAEIRRTYEFDAISQSVQDRVERDLRRQTRHTSSNSTCSSFRYCSSTIMSITDISKDYNLTKEQDDLFTRIVQHSTLGIWNKDTITLVFWYQ